MLSLKWRRKDEPILGTYWTFALDENVDVNVFSSDDFPGRWYAVAGWGDDEWRGPDCDTARAAQEDGEAMLLSVTAMMIEQFNATIDGLECPRCGSGMKASL